jgi:hypothetical protein
MIAHSMIMKTLYLSVYHLIHAAYWVTVCQRLVIVIVIVIVIVVY